MENQGPSLDTAPAQDDISTELDADPATQSALLRIAQPDTMFTQRPGTSARLLHTNAARISVRPTLVALAFWLPLIAALLAMVGPPLWIWCAALVFMVATLSAEVYWRARRQLAGVFAETVPARTWAVRFGADGLDIGDDEGLSRITHDRLQSVSVSRDVAVLRFDGQTFSVPAPLFPPHAVDRLHSILDGNHPPSAADVPPLPPLPTLPDPQAVYIAEPGTAHALATAQQSYHWRRTPGKVAAVGGVILTIEFGLVATLRFGVLGAVVAAAIAAMIGLGIRYHLHHPTERALRRVRSFAYPGAQLSMQFGSDGILMATPTFRLGVAHSSVDRIDLRGTVAVVQLGRLPVFLPSALFGPHVVAELRELGVDVTAH